MEKTIQKLILATASMTGLAIAATLLQPPHAAAQAADATGTLASADEARYQASVGEAVAEFAAGHWAEARSLFTEAHRIYPNARTLRGLGMTAFELRNYVEATHMLAQSLRSQVNVLTPEQAAKTRALLERTRSFIGVFTVQAPAGMTLRVDGAAAAYEEQGRLMLNPGKRALTPIYAEGTGPVRHVDVRGGEDGTLVFEAYSASAAPTPATPPVAVPLVTEESESQRGEPAAAVPTVERDSGSVLPVVLMVGGGLLVGGGVVTGLMAKGKESDLEDACAGMTPCAATNRSLADDADTLALVTNVLWIGGAVVGGLGLTLLLLDDDDEAPVTAQLGLTGGGINLAGKF